MDGVSQIYVSATSPYDMIIGSKKSTFLAGKIWYIFKGGIVKDIEGNYVKDVVFPIKIIPYGGYVVINGKPYRGSLEIYDGLRVINIVLLEDYLKGVLPYEIGFFVSKEEFEALKAQAVVARTYTLYKLLKGTSEWQFDLYATVKDQVYGGAEIENKWINLAVDKTRGEILLYKGKIINALYHSTCGGKTAYYWESFGKYNFPYLKSRKCNFCKNSPKYNWKIKLSLNEFKNLLASNLRRYFRENVYASDIKSFSILARGPSGRVTKFAVFTTRGRIIVKYGNIRKLLAYNGRLLNSNLFWIRFLGSYVEIIGKGWGHGVGMCQWGALNMSKKGINYKKILKYYYKGVEIKRLYY